MQTSGSAAIKKLIQLVKAAVSDALAEAKAYTDNAAAGGADYIESQGTTGKWTWRKWHSGVAEMWGVFGPTELTLSNAWNGIYYGTWMYAQANVDARRYPFSFIESPSVQATYSSGDKYAWLMSAFLDAGDPLTSAPAYALVRPDAATILNPGISYYVVGRYK